MNEVNNYKQAVMSYYVSKGKLPGDRKNLGKIGIDSGNDGDFEDAGYLDYSDGWLPFYDMDKEGILDFDKEKDGFGGWSIGKRSNVIKNAYYEFIYLDDNNPSDDYYPFLKGINSSTLELNPKYNSFIPVKMMSFIDQKMDDNEALTGKILASCTNYKPKDLDREYTDEYNGGATYTESIDNQGICIEAFFLLDI